MKKNKNEWKKIFDNKPYDGMYELNIKGQLRNVKSKKIKKPDGITYRVYVKGKRYYLGTVNILRWKYFKGEITSEMYLKGWKKLNKVYDVPGYYFANKYGNIFDVKNQRFRKWCSNELNYQIMIIEHNGSKINISQHRTIGLLFIPNPDNKPEIDHIDRDPSNNNISNLRWVTHSEQMKNRSIDNDFYSYIGKNGSNVRWNK
jgi:hypothetical protein